MVFRAASSASARTSIMVTSKPFCAKTCTIPFPIVPAPITATFRISAIVVDFP